MQTLALHPAVNARPTGDLDATLAQPTLRRVEAKELVFFEGDPTSDIGAARSGPYGQPPEGLKSGSASSRRTAGFESELLRDQRV
jgi:hypothetical protein